MKWHTFGVVEETLALRTIPPKSTELLQLYMGTLFFFQ